MNLEFLRGINTNIKQPIVATQQYFIYTTSGTLIVHDIQSQQQKIMPIHDKKISAFDFNNVNGQIATGQEGTDDYKEKKAFIAIIDISQMKMVKYLMDFNYGIEDLKYSNCGKFLAAHGWDFQLIVYNSSDYSKLLTIKQERIFPSITWNLDYQNSEQTCFYLIESRKIRQFYLNNKKDSFQENMQILQNKELRNFDNPIYDNLSKSLVCGTAQGEIVVFQKQNIKQAIFKKVSQNPILSIIKFNDKIFCVTQNQQLLQLDIQKDGKINVIKIVQTQNHPVNLFCSKQKLFYLCKNGGIFQIENDIQYQNLILQQPNEQIQDCNLDYSDQQIIQYTSKGYLNIYNQNGQKINNFKNPKQLNTTSQKMHYDEDHKVFTLAYQNGDIYIFDSINFMQKGFISTAHKGLIQNIYRNNKFLLTCCDQCLLRIWSTKNYQLVHEFNYHSKAITYCSAFGDESEMIISSAKDKQIIIFDLKREKKVRIFQIQNGFVQDMLILNNKQFISVGHNTPLTLWSIDSNTPLKVVEEESKCLKIKLCKDNNQIAILTESGEIKLYELNTLQKISEIRVSYCQIVDIFWLNKNKIIFVEETGAFGVVKVNQIQCNINHLSIKFNKWEIMYKHQVVENKQLNLTQI